MILLPIFEEEKNITTILNGLLFNEQFLAYCSKGQPRPETFVPGKLKKTDLVNGYCDKVANFVKDIFPGARVCKTKDHFFIKYKDKYYDGSNTGGVDSPEKLDYFSGMTKDQVDKEFKVLNESVTRAEIESYLKELVSRDVENEDGEYNVFKDSVFGDHQTVLCTTGAMEIANHFGGKVYGYPLEGDDQKGKIGYWADGHDFAIVGNFLVDYWAKYVEDEGKAIYDLTDEADMKLVDKLYLPRKQWKVVPMWKKINKQK